ncbi:serine/threonine-protein kinase [Methanolacinia paynteri]|uniref:serine/threonine-protein kinase n=1 Tax=Methanolacinia paynteri TaxID=230356 RepID=UPI0006939787|nr:serine/threonine-protein kinase [Methanolacinia paynteri]
MLILLSVIFIPVQAAYGSQSSVNDHSMGMGHYDENESHEMPWSSDAGSGSGIQAILPLIYGLFAVVVVLVLIIVYIVFIRHRREKPGDEGVCTAVPVDSDSCGVAGGNEKVSAADFPSELNEKYSDAVLTGRGGLSFVYSVKSKETGETVAVKVPAKRDERSGKVFLQEVKIWEELDHPNIVSLKSVNVFPVPYVEMEYIPDSLETIEKPMESDVAIQVAVGVLRGLSYAHKKGIVHCDIKPANILIDDDFTPKITDWGVGRSEKGGGTEFHGYTPAFAAPEQVSPGVHGCTGKTDIFQVGMLILRMVCGKTVFEKNLGKDPGAYLDDCIKDEKLRAVVSKCIRKDPGERYESAEELLSELMSVSGNTVLN